MLPNAALSVARMMIAHDAVRSTAADVSGRSHMTALAVPSAGAVALLKINVPLVSSVLPDDATARQRMRAHRCHGKLDSEPVPSAIAGDVESVDGARHRLAIQLAVASVGAH